MHEEVEKQRAEERRMDDLRKRGVNMEDLKRMEDARKKEEARRAEERKQLEEQQLKKNEQQKRLEQQVGKRTVKEKSSFVKFCRRC
eukprot:XP_011665182.1 PREDICTED: outer spore wall assembly protein SHE10 [Strongylocentrotus purpuratus]